MRHVGYKPYPSDPGLWINPKVDIDSDRYYSYILCYVDDILVIHQDAMNMLKNIDKYFKLKPDSIDDPERYLGAKLRYHRTNNGVYAW